MLLIIQLIN